MPRLYSKRIGKHKVDNRVRQKVEERDAIIWTVDSENDIVYLKIQGSDTLVRAYYHQVIHTFPGYLKAGAAAMIRFRRGTKGIVDVIGTGRAVPTPVGEGSVMPPISLADMVISGMEVTATDPYSMSVQVASGVYRINNVLYTFAGTANFFYTMHSPAPLLMGTDNVTMGGQYYTVTIPAAPSTSPYGRIDILVIGTDQVVEVVSGTEVNLSTTEPIMPTIPANHILLGWILIKYGDTYVTSSMINAAYGAPTAAAMHVVLTGGWITTEYWNGDEDDPFHYVLEWNPQFPPQTQPSCGIQITLTDQYGSTMNFGGARGRLTLYGMGQVYGSYTGWSSTYAESAVGTSASFQYVREQPMDGGDPMDYSPGLAFEVEGFSGGVPCPLQGAGGVLL